MRPAIMEPAITQLVAEGRELLANVVTSEREAAWHRVVLGRFLLLARSRLPRRGTPTEGWGAFLEAVEIDDMTATRYMKLAEAAVNLTERDKDKVPTYGQLGLDNRTGPEPDPNAPPPSDDDAPREADEDAQDDEVDIDRDTWCTPKWITEAIGEFDLDPCANERSHVQAKKAFDLDRRGEDGLVLAPASKRTRAFINPPYSDVMPWVQAYKHTRFCFLLKVDPSTKWFEALLAATQLVLIPRRTRVQFEAPPGVPPKKALANQFPHALFYAHAQDATDAIAALCFPGWFMERR